MIGKVGSVEYKRPAIGHDYSMSFPVPDGQSSYWALWYDWLNACPCGEYVSELFYCINGEMKRLQTDGRRHGDGLNKCYRVLLWYSHHLPHRSGRAVTACGSPQTANCPLSFCPLLIGMLAMNWMGKKSLKRNADPVSFSRSARVRDRVPIWRAKGTEPGCGPREDTAGRGKHQLAGKRTTNNYAWSDSLAEMNKHENEQILTSIYMQGEVTKENNGTLQSILLLLVLYRI